MTNDLLLCVQPHILNSHQWQVETVGNDWEESRKALEKLVCGIESLPVHGETKMLQNKTGVPSATAKHMFSQWSNVTCKLFMQV